MTALQNDDNIGFRFETAPEHANFLCDAFGVTIDDFHECNEVLDLIQGESERGMTLLAASLFDVRLEKLANILLQFGSSKLRNEITDFPGPLSSFSSRIKLLFAMGVIDADTFESLQIIRGLRNTCAHKPQDFKFSEIEVWSKIEKIPLTFVIGDSSPQPSSKFAGKKTQFQLKVGMILLGKR
jgi:hypothetical protein